MTNNRPTSSPFPGMHPGPQGQGGQVISAVPRETVDKALLDTAAHLSRMRADTIQLYSMLSGLKETTARGRDQLRRATMGAIGSAPVDMSTLAGDTEVGRLEAAMQIVATLAHALGKADDNEALLAPMPAPPSNEAA